MTDHGVAKSSKPTSKRRVDKQGVAPRKSLMGLCTGGVADYGQSRCLAKSSTKIPHMCSRRSVIEMREMAIGP
jgi:hypothetical protein